MLSSSCGLLAVDGVTGGQEIISCQRPPSRPSLAAIQATEKTSSTTPHHLLHRYLPRPSPHAGSLFLSNINLWNQHVIVRTGEAVEGNGGDGWDGMRTTLLNGGRFSV